jgi:hypothetical protein
MSVDLVRALQRVIARAVIDDDDLDVRLPDHLKRRREALEASLESSALIERRDDDGQVDHQLGTRGTNQPGRE